MTVRRKQSTGAVGMRLIAARNASRHIGAGSTRRTARDPSGGAKESEGGRGSDTQSSLQTKSSVGDSYFVQGADSYCGDSLGITRGRELLVPTVLFSESQKKMFSKNDHKCPLYPEYCSVVNSRKMHFW